MGSLVMAVEPIMSNPVITADQAQAMRDMSGMDGNMLSGLGTLGCSDQEICWEQAYNDMPLRGRDINYAIVGLAGIDGGASYGSVSLGSLGASGFNVGDSFTLAITGAPPNAPVYVVADGVSTPAQMGTTNGSGSFSMSAIWQASDVGSHSQFWFVGAPDGTNTHVTPYPLAFTVNAAAVAAPPATIYSPKVALQDSTGSSTYKVGDSFTLLIIGAPPNAPVYVIADGAANWSQAGSTDVNGHFSQSGTWAASDAGQHNQQWGVGNGSALVQTSPVSLTFAVQPAVAAVVYAPHATLTDSTSGASLSGIGDFMDATFTVPQNPIMAGSSMNGMLNGLAALRGMGAIDTTSLSNFVTSVESGSSAVFGYTLPNWALVGGGLLALFMLSGGAAKHRGR